MTSAAAKVLPPDERHERGLPMLTPDADADLPPPPALPLELPAHGKGDGGGSANDSPPPGVPEPGTPFTDLGNAERFAAQHHQDLRYCRPLGGWFIWTSSHWARDEVREAERRAHLTARRFYADIVAPLAQQLERATTKEEAERLRAILDAAMKWAKTSESAPRLAAMVGEARNIPPIPVAREVFDGKRTNFLLNCTNVTVDLETGNVHPHRREDLITKCTTVPYDRTARAPKFRAFLEEILPDASVRAWLQRWAGYIATGVIREHVLPVWFGDGANGKGTLAELLKAVLGSYAIACPEGFFEEQKHQQHATEIARLRGVRLAVGSETRASSALAESKIKRLTGGDTLTGRFMREDFFDFEPTAKFVLFTNYKPRIRGSDNGIRRRVQLVPFEVTIPEARRDPELGERLLREEGPGVLQWIIEGAQLWRENGWKLDPPESIRAATEDYLAHEDLLGRFLEDVCTVTKPGDSAVKSEPAHLFAAFQRWATAAGEEPGTQRAFLELLGQRGFTAVKSNGRRWIRGVAPMAQHDEGRSGRDYHD